MAASGNIYSNLYLPKDNSKNQNIYSNLYLPKEEDNKISSDDSLKMIESLTGLNRTPIDTIRDLSQGILTGLGKGGQFIGQGAMKLLGRQPNNYNPDIGEELSSIGSPNKSLGGQLVKGVGEYLPFGELGGTSLLGKIGAGGLYGASEYQKGQENLATKLFGIPTTTTSNMLEGAIVNLLTHGMLAPFKAKADKFTPINYKVNLSEPDNYKATYSFPSNKAGALHYQNPVLPSFLTEEKNPQLSQNIANELHSQLVGNKSFEDSSKNLASTLASTYKNVRDEHVDAYNQFFKSPTDEISYATGEPISIGDTGMYGSKYLDEYGDYKFPEKNLQMTQDKFLDGKRVEDAHWLQAELGSEIGALKNQNEKGTLDSAGRQKLKEYKKIQDTLKQSIVDKVDDISPESGKQYRDLGQSWKSNVEIFHGDKDLKSIATGRTTNPTSGQINSIFRNPEPSIEKVVSMLPDSAKQNIVHIGMGKNRFQNSPNDLLKGEETLYSKGLHSYIPPYHEQLFRNLRNNVAKESEEGEAFNKNQKLVERLMRLYEQSKEKASTLSEKSRENFQSAKSESTALTQDMVKKLNEQNEANINLQNKARERRNNAIRTILGGGLGIGAVNLIGAKPEDLIGAYLGKNLTKIKIK